MKRAMVYLIALSALLTALLTGCGEGRMNQPGTTPTSAPETTILPEQNMPDETDGIVGDTDGIITKDDNGGAVTEKTDNGMIGGETAADREASDAVQGSGSTTVGANSLVKNTKSKKQ